jgi:hypothetical protein
VGKLVGDPIPHRDGDLVCTGTALVLSQSITRHIAEPFEISALRASNATYRGAVDLARDGEEKTGALTTSVRVRHGSEASRAPRGVRAST